MIDTLDNRLITPGKISVESLQHVFNAFNFGILIEDSNRVIIYTNKRFMSIFGIPGEPEILEGIYCPDTALQAKDYFKDSQKFLQDIVNIPLCKKAQEELVETIDGRFLLRKYAPIIEDTEIVHHIWTYEDVTILMAKQKELNTQKNFFSTVLNEIPADIAIFSPEHKYLFVNKMGIKNPEIREWIIGKDDYEYCAYRGFPSKIADSRRGKFNQAKETKQSATWIDEITDASGKTNYILRIFYPYINDADELELVIGYGVNINNQKENEITLLKQKERMQTMVDTLNDGVFQLTFESKIIFFNEAFLRIMNISRATITDTYTESIMNSVHPDDIYELYEAHTRLKDTKDEQYGIFRIVDEHGNVTSHIDYLIWFTNDPEFGDTVTGRLSDITERIVHEQNMQTVIEKEKELNNLKSHFIHITSHELRTPLAVIMSSAEILEMCLDPQTAKQTEGISMDGFTSGIIKEVNRITETLNEMMMVGKIEKGNIKYKPEWTDVREYLNIIAGELYLPYKDGRKLEMEIDADVNEVYFDPTLMRHAIVNLLNNAFKFSAGQQAPLLKVFKKEENICIQVNDYGIGIPEEEEKMLFNSFFRASNVGNIAGTGIGLMVVDHVMKLHNGTTEVISKKNAGASFTLAIPHTNVL